MRKNDVRKWIHATLDMLPLLIIPIFALAVRSDNNFEPIIITNTEPYYYQSNDVESELDLQSDNVYRWNDNFPVSTSDAGKVLFYIKPTDWFVSQFTDIEYTYDVAYLTINSQGRAFVDLRYNNTYVISLNAFSTVFDFVLFNYNQNNIGLALPHISRTNSLYLKGYNTNVLYNDTDVGSQMVYTLYNSVDKYFNFNNVFTFDQIYDWLSINIFAGQPPLSVFIVWNIFLYEFLMDLLFLLYALFMFFIDMCTNLIERFTCQARGGR